ncbi:hypothetical protein LXL04_021956 [Taraxacum kok-saghyz]
MDCLDGSWTLWGIGGQKESNEVVKVGGKRAKSSSSTFAARPRNAGVMCLARTYLQMDGRRWEWIPVGFPRFFGVVEVVLKGCKVLSGYCSGYCSGSWAGLVDCWAWADGSWAPVLIGSGVTPPNQKLGGNVWGLRDVIQVSQHNRHSSNIAFDIQIKQKCENQGKIPQKDAKINQKFRRKKVSKTGRRLDSKTIKKKPETGRRKPDQVAVLEAQKSRSLIQHLACSTRRSTAPTRSTRDPLPTRARVRLPRARATSRSGFSPLPAPALRLPSQVAPFPRLRPDMILQIHLLRYALEKIKNHFQMKVIVTSQENSSLTTSSSSLATFFSISDKKLGNYVLFRDTKVIEKMKIVDDTCKTFTYLNFIRHFCF